MGACSAVPRLLVLACNGDLTQSLEDQILELDLVIQLALETRDDLYRAQRVATQVKELVVDADVIGGQHASPDSGNGDLGFSARAQ